MEVLALLRKPSQDMREAFLCKCSASAILSLVNGGVVLTLEVQEAP